LEDAGDAFLVVVAPLEGELERGDGRDLLGEQAELALHGLHAGGLQLVEPRQLAPAGRRLDLEPLREDVLALLLVLLELGERLGFADAELDLLALHVVERQVLFLYSQKLEKPHLVPCSLRRKPKTENRKSGRGAPLRPPPGGGREGSSPPAVFIRFSIFHFRFSSSGGLRFSRLGFLFLGFL